MASSKESQVPLVTDITTTCPICFESFKTPRILPCSHTFCHNCLSSYIISTCGTKESPVGFPCPLCRGFVPAPISDKIEKWTELIPVNKIIQVLIEKGDHLCDACQREDEEMVASDWCESCTESLCAVCAKSHRRSAVSRKHTLVSLADFNKVSGGKERIDSVSVLCQDHSKRVKYLCVDHEELCCTKCVCTKHRKCAQIDDIEEAAESLRKSKKLETLSTEISQYEGLLMKAKSDGEDTLRYIDDASDQIREESAALRDEIVKHVNGLLENLLSELARNAKEHKGSLSSFVDAASDRQLLMAQYLHALDNTEKTPASVLVRDYYMIKRQFGHATRSGFSQIKIQLQSSVSEELTRILQVTKFKDLKIQMKSIPLNGIDFSSANMRLIYQLPCTSNGITGGCFLENGDIILAHPNSSQLLHYSNAVLVRKADLDMAPQDAVCQNTSLLLISQKLKKRRLWGHIGTLNLDKLEEIKDKVLTKTSAHSLAISVGFIYAACSTVIIKFDHERNVVRQYPVDMYTYSVAVNNNNEIISSSCSTHIVTVMDNSGEKIFTYSDNKLRYPQGLDVNFSGNIFVAGRESFNLHVLTPKAELLKIFSTGFSSGPRCIKFKENTNVCFIGFNETTANVYEFEEY